MSTVTQRHQALDHLADDFKATEESVITESVRLLKENQMTGEQAVLQWCKIQALRDLPKAVAKNIRKEIGRPGPEKS